MEKFQPIINQIKEKEHQQKIKDLFAKITETYPQLDTTVKWNQPMFTDHGTFIIAFSFAKNHFSIAPEKAAIRALEKNIQEAGYVYTDNVIKVPWKSVINWELIEQLISFNIEDKKGHDKFLAIKLYTNKPFTGEETIHQLIQVLFNPILFIIPG